MLQILISLFALHSCKQKDESSHEAGIAISFDDHFIDEWYALRPMFQKYGAKVTFYITCPDSLTADEVLKLKQLENDGHEIAFHGTVHAKSTELIAGGPEGYIQTEIAPGLQHMRNAGFRPVTYAHPGGNHNDRVDSVLFANGFKLLRDVGISKRKYAGIQLYAVPPKWMNSIFYGFDQQKTVDALLIDTDSGVTEHEMREAMDKAIDKKKVLMMFGHEPLYAAPVNGEYGFSVPFLEQILKDASQRKLPFYTMRELAEQQ